MTAFVANSEILPVEQRFLVTKAHLKINKADLTCMLHRDNLQRTCPAIPVGELYCYVEVEVEIEVRDTKFA